MKIGLEDTKIFLSVILFCFEIVIYINFLTIVWFPDGLYPTETTNFNWFLGYDNTHIVFFLPAFLIALIYREITKKKIRSAVLITVIIVSSLIRWAATTVMGMAIFIILLIPIFRKNTKIFNFKTYMIATLVIFITMVLLRLQNYLSFIIVDILGKDLTFRNRTPLWDTTIEYIKENIALGYGWQGNDVRHAMYNSSSVISAHNQVLEYIYLGGIPLIAIYIYMIVYINKISNKIKENKIVQYISIAFFALQIMYITEVFINPIIYLILIIALYSDRIVDKYNELRRSTTNG